MTDGASKDWLATFADQAAVSDQLRTHEAYPRLLAIGLYGEAGSVLAELKKSAREGNVYPGYRENLVEEIGDFLWYFVRLTATLDPTLLADLPRGNPSKSRKGSKLESSMRFAVAVAQILHCLETRSRDAVRTSLLTTWNEIRVLAKQTSVDLRMAARVNYAKTHSRWPADYQFAALLDEGYREEEQLPRSLKVEFREIKRGSRVEILLRYKGITLGDRLTDNILDRDGYRYHDIFHYSNVVFLGWSPVARALLRCKRKSEPAVDENEDGARAVVLEEAITALVFSRAKMMRFFEGAKQVDYDLLKTIQGMINGYEVQTIPMWQWERAILEGYRVFRRLSGNHGGVVTWDLPSHRLDWSPL